MSQITPSSHKCENPSCKKLTTNPKFCSQSCSATVANKLKPKRSPQGSCERCGVAQSTSKRFCDECREVLTADKQRAEANIKSYLALDEQVIEKPFPRVSCSKRTVFTIGIRNIRLDEKNTCGDLIDAVVSLCLSQPIFLRKEDCPRYVSLLHDFSECTLEIHSYPKNYSGKVRTMPIGFLGRAIEHWIFSHAADGRALLAHYALDTAELIGIVAEGGYKGNCELEPLCPSLFNNRPLSDVFDKGFKKRFTEQARLIVSAEVPQLASVVFNDETILTPGDKLTFEFARCHLSHGVYEYRYLNVVRDLPPLDFDLMPELELKGHLIRSGDPLGVRDPGWFDLPISWITHELHRANRGGASTWVAAPRWHGGGDTTQENAIRKLHIVPTIQ